MDLHMFAFSILLMGYVLCVTQAQTSDPVEELRAELRAMKVQLMDTTQRLHTLTKYVTEPHIDTQVLEDSGPVLPSEVAFSTQLLSPKTNLPIGSTLKFDQIHTNSANAYDPSTGIFTVPVTGQYLFGFFIRALGSSKMSVVLKIDGVSMVTGMADDDDSAGNMFIGILNAGQQVWIETIETEPQSFHAHFTTFSGIYLH